MASVFTKIAQGEIPGHVVYEDERCFAFLDINPRKEGHTLVAPRVEVDQLFDLDEADHAALWAAARRVAAALREATGCVRVSVMVVGFDVPHAHIHLIPTWDASDVPFPPVDRRAADTLAETADRVRRALA
jgi:histidine triad (HIT) family protein